MLMMLFDLKMGLWHVFGQLKKENQKSFLMTAKVTLP